MDKKTMLTAPEIEKKLGGTLDWNETKRAIKKKKLKIYAWDPKLESAFKDVSQTLWKPMGALMPKWRSVPRRIAVVNSYASKIFGDVRWPKTAPMHQQLVDMGIPYDILVDQDFEKNLKQEYDVIMFPKCYAMTQPTFNYLKKFIANGGTVLVDDMCKVELPGVTKINMADKVDTSELRKKEVALLKKYHNRTEYPQFVEAMEALAQQKMESTENKELTKILNNKLKSFIKCKTKAVCWNLLEAEGVQYLFAVNDLRVPGPFYGRYAKCREKGVAQAAQFEYLGNAKYAYDLLTNKQVKLHNRKLLLKLKPSGASIIMFTNQPIRRFKVSSTPFVPQGKDFPVTITMTGLKRGLIPVELILTAPSGRKSSLSHYDVIKNGKLRWNIPVAWNAPVGKWHLKVKELASGLNTRIGFTVRQK